MYAASSIVLLLAIGSRLANAASQIPVNLFADKACKVVSTITPNSTVTLDSCIVTIGLQSFNFPPTPCAGGTASTVQYFAFEDQRCSTKDYVSSYGSNCYGHISEGRAIGSILMSCNTSPKPDGTVTTVTVAPVASGSTPTATSVAGSSSGSSGSPGSSTSSSTSDSSNNCSGFSCLPYAARIAIILSLSIGVPAIGWSGYRRYRNKKRIVNIEAQHGTMQHTEIYPIVPLEPTWQKQPQATATGNVVNIYNHPPPPPPPGPQAQSPPPGPHAYSPPPPPNPIQSVNDHDNYHYPPPPKYTQ